MAVKRRFQSVKGMRDLVDEAPAFAEVEETARRVFSLYGYHEVRTPVVEDTELFVRGVGEASEIVGKQMYSFDDKKGRSLSLRPEGTAPVARAYLEHDMASWPQPVKVFYMGPYFRYERPQAGRYRQFNQIGAELIGDPGPYSDVELLVMLLRFLEEVGFQDLEVGLNSVGDPECRRRYSRRLREYLEPHRDDLGADSLRRLETNPLRILDTKAPKERELLEGAPRLREVLGSAAQSHFEVVCEQLARFDVDFEIDNRLVRGLDYYTRTVFEITSVSLGAQDAILGGGRYDGLIADLGGPSVPGIGFAIGEDRLVSLFRHLYPGRRVSGASPQEPVCVVPVGASYRRHGLELSQALRAAGITAICEFDALRPLKVGLKQANRRGCRWVVLIGEDEVAAGTVVLRDFENGTQETIQRDEFVDVVATRISA
ncbi:MAG: histidine--tRNA ligase [Holophagales bacterium]|nr:histidine--tRNA ligase [Holophagales bacterium]MYD22050.1 histidine--tRNA ligase [Holophagales bacterium]MYI32887.1 histidine--tRNA ligase [Holophagales bacterium]